MEPITREEVLLSGEQLTPITRKEMFLAKIAGMDVETPEPITREEMFLSKVQTGGSNSAPVIEPLTVTENGTYEAPSGVDGYNPVTVNVAGSGGDDSYGIKWTTHKSVGNAYSARPTEIQVISHDGIFYSYMFGGSGDDDFVWVGGNTKKQAGLFDLVTSIVFDVDPSAGDAAIMSYAFYKLYSLETIKIPKEVHYVYESGFYNCTALETVTFEGTPFASGLKTNAFYNCTNLTTINVPWAEGAVSGAPWGATNATINYNYTGG